MVNATNRITIEAIFKGLGFEKATAGMEKFQKTTKKAAAAMTKVLGGKTIDIGTQDLGQNISAIANRLGFMAFQWNFMANAANRALDAVLGGMQRVITEGAQMSDSLTRALSFATPATEIRNMSQKAVADITKLRDAIYSLGSGQTIFGIDTISSQAAQLQKAFDNLDATKTILPFAAKLKTIEPTLSDEKLGTGLVSLFEALGTNTSDVNDVARAMDFLSNVSDKSTQTFQDAIGSLGVAAQEAKGIGFTATETGLAITQVADVLARNLGGGRASSTAGHYAQAFFRDLNKIADAETKQGSFARLVNLDIFDKDAKGKPVFKDLISIIDVFRNKLSGLSSGDKASFLNQLGLSANSQSVINALLTKETKTLQKLQDELKERGTLEARAAAITTSGQSQILRMQAAVNSLKVSLANGFAPALKAVADALSEIAGNKEFQQLMSEIGSILADTITPALKDAARFLRSLFAFLKKNPKTLKTLIGLFVALTAAIAGLSIIATIGFFALVAGGSFLAMAGQMALANAAGLTLKKTMGALLLRFVKFGLLGVGVLILASSLSGVFDTQLTPAMEALGVALTLLSGAWLVGFGNVKTLITGIPGIITSITTGVKDLPSKLVGIGAKISEAIFGSTTGRSGVDPFNPLASADITKLGVIQKLKDAFSKSNFAKAGIIGAAVAAAAFVIFEIAQEMERRVEDDPFFKTGFAEKGHEMMFQFQAAFASGVAAIGKFFTETIPKVIGGALDNMIKSLQGAFGALGLAWEKLSKGDFAGALKSLQESWDNFWKNFKGPDIGKELRRTFDPKFLALDEIEHRLQVFKERIAAGEVVNRNTVLDSVAAVLKATNTTQDFSSAEILQLIKNTLGGDFFTQTQQSLALAISDGVKVSVDHNAIQTKTNELLSKENAELAKHPEDIKQNSKAIDLHSDIVGVDGDVVKEKTVATGENTKRLDDHTFNVVSNSKSIIENIDFLKREIVEIAKNTNIMISFSETLLQANVMFARLIAEGNRAAAKLSTLSVSSKGVFKLGNPGINADDSRAIFNAQKELSAFRNSKELANITSLKAELEQITTVLHEANRTIESTNNASIASKIASIDTSVLGGKAPAFKTENGITSIDINVDGKFDIDIKNGGLTEKDVETISAKFGDKIAKEFATKIGVILS